MLFNTFPLLLLYHSGTTTACYKLSFEYGNVYILYKGKVALRQTEYENGANVGVEGH